MSRWLIWIGCGVVVIGLLLLSPVADLLPIDWVLWPSGSSAHHAYFRVVPSSNESHLPQIILAALVFIGIALIFAGRLLGSRKRK